MCAFHDIMLQRQFSFTVLDHPDGCSSDDVAKLKATVSKFRRQSEIISAARQKISRDLTLTGKYTTKHRDRHVITREPGGAIRGSRVMRKQPRLGGEGDAADDASAGLELQGDDAELLAAADVQGSQAQDVMQRTAGKGPLVNAATAPADTASRTSPSSATSPATPGAPQLVYRWDLTNAINALIAKSEAFARSVKPHIVSAAQGAFSLKEIARRLDEQGIKTVTGKNWNNVVLSHVIQRGVVMGEQEYRRLFDRFITQPGRADHNTVRQKKKKVDSAAERKV